MTEDRSQSPIVLKMCNGFVSEELNTQSFCQNMKDFYDSCDEDIKIEFVESLYKNNPLLHVIHQKGDKDLDFSKENKQQYFIPFIACCIYIWKKQQILEDGLQKF